MPEVKVTAPTNLAELQEALSRLYLLNSSHAEQPSTRYAFERKLTRIRQLIEEHFKLPIEEIPAQTELPKTLRRRIRAILAQDANTVPI